MLEKLTLDPTPEKAVAKVKGRIVPERYVFMAAQSTPAPRSDAEFKSRKAQTSVPTVNATAKRGTVNDAFPFTPSHFAQYHERRKTTGPIMKIRTDFINIAA